MFKKITLVVVPKKSACPLILGMDFVIANSLEIDVNNRNVIRQLPDGSRYLWQVDENGNLQEACLHRVRCVAAKPVKLDGAKNIQVPLAFADEVLAQVQHMRGNPLLLCEGISPPRHQKFHTVPGIVDPAHMTVLMSAIPGQSTQIRKGDVVGVVSSVLELDHKGDDFETWSNEKIQKEIPLGQLNEQQRDLVWGMLGSCQEVLSAGDHDVGTASVTAHKINLYDDTPVY